MQGKITIKEICFAEDDFKRQTAADVAIHFKSFYCKKKVNS